VAKSHIRSFLRWVINIIAIIIISNIIIIIMKLKDRMPDNAKEVKESLKAIINGHVASRYFFEHSAFNNDLT
jgi:hypothetical protein